MVDRRQSSEMFKLGVVAAMFACEFQGKVYTHLSFGRVLSALRDRLQQISVCLPVFYGKPPSSRDYKLESERVSIVKQPPYVTTVGGLRRPLGVIKSYWAICNCSDVVFIRGMVPYIGFLYFFCALMRRRTCHWIVGNPEALLRSHRRRSRLQDWMALSYARCDRFLSRCGSRLTRGTFICNGAELGRLYASKRTRVVVSTSIKSDEINYRDNPEITDTVHVLFVGFIRPEKGLEYLLKAVSQLKLDREWRLRIVGDAGEFGDYLKKMQGLVQELDLEDRVEWSGYISFGPEMRRVFQNSDVLVLPSLSEGTPRVLVEARANGVPVIASNVGGIPSSVEDRKDGILVPPKDPEAIARAIEALVSDGEVRRALVQAGYRRVEGLTVEDFAGQIVKICSGDR